MKKLKHAAKYLAGIVVAATPAVLASPGVQHFIENHAIVAAYFPIVATVIAVLLHKDAPLSS